MPDLATFLFITSAIYSRTFSRVSKFLRRIKKTSLRPSYKPFITLLIVAKDDNKSAGRREDASEKHCCLTNIVKNERNIMLYDYLQKTKIE
jgi:hypothetical protein